MKKASAKRGADEDNTGRTWNVRGVFFRIKTLLSDCVRFGQIVSDVRSCSLDDCCSSRKERKRPWVSVAFSGSSGAELWSPQMASPP